MKPFTGYQCLVIDYTQYYALMMLTCSLSTTLLLSFYLVAVVCSSLQAVL